LDSTNFCNGKVGTWASMGETCLPCPSPLCIRYCPNWGVECRCGIGKIEILVQYLVPSRAVHDLCGAMCNTLSCNGPWQVDALVAG